MPEALIVEARLGWRPQLSGRWPLMLDGIAAAAVNGLHDRRRHLVDCLPTGPIDCRTSTRSRGREGGKKPDSRHLALTKDRFGRRLASSEAQLQDRRCVPREYRLPLEWGGDPSTGDEWWWQASRAEATDTGLLWRCNGSDDILDLLTKVTDITPPRSVARSEAWPVEDWIVSLDDDGGSWVGDPRMRPIPAATTYAGPTVEHAIRPPYWHTINLRRCMAP